MSTKRPIVSGFRRRVKQAMDLMREPDLYRASQGSSSSVQIVVQTAHTPFHIHDAPLDITRPQDGRVMIHIEEVTGHGKS